MRLLVLEDIKTVWKYLALYGIMAFVYKKTNRNMPELVVWITRAGYMYTLFILFLSEKKENLLYWFWTMPRKRSFIVFEKNIFIIISSVFFISIELICEVKDENYLFSLVEFWANGVIILFLYFHTHVGVVQMLPMCFFIFSRIWQVQFEIRGNYGIAIATIILVNALNIYRLRKKDILVSKERNDKAY